MFGITLMASASDEAAEAEAEKENAKSEINAANEKIGKKEVK